MSYKNVLVTGGAGFIGSHVVDKLISNGAHVTVIDNLASGYKSNLSHNVGSEQFNLIEADILDRGALDRAMHGQDTVWHLAAHSNIASSLQNPELDLSNTLLTTTRVLETMRSNNVRNLLFTSSGSVYGDHPGPLSESTGPCLPESLYSASKLSSEAFIRVYASLFGIHALIFRLGNVVGRRLRRGVIYSFLEKLSRNPQYLDVLGNGTQTKPFVLIQDCISGFFWASQAIRLTDETPHATLNLGPDTSTSVERVAQIVIDALGLHNVVVDKSESERGWPGDQPHVSFCTDRMQQLGWSTEFTSDEAVQHAVRQMISERVVRC